MRRLCSNIESFWKEVLDSLLCILHQWASVIVHLRKRGNRRVAMYHSLTRVDMRYLKVSTLRLTSVNRELLSDAACLYFVPFSKVKRQITLTVGPIRPLYSSKRVLHVQLPYSHIFLRKHSTQRMQCPCGVAHDSSEWHDSSCRALENKLWGC